MLDLNSPQKAHFLPVVRSILKEFGLTNPDDVQWHPDERGDNFTVVFTVEDKVDELKDTLVSYGLGADFGRISLFPVKMSLPKRALKSKKAESSGDLGGVLAKIQETMASREIVEHVEALIEAGAVFSFDYLMLVIVASLLAAYGLAVNSSVVVVASMLVSPIMGPILAITFGAVIGKWQLVRIGLKVPVMCSCACYIVHLFALDILSLARPLSLTFASFHSFLLTFTRSYSRSLIYFHPPVRRIRSLTSERDLKSHDLRNHWIALWNHRRMGRSHLCPC